MTTVKEFYEKLTILLVKNPKINDMNIDACGAPGSLFIWKKNPNGPITGISYEDDSFVSEHFDNVLSLTDEMNLEPLPDHYMQYLVQLSMEGTCREDIEEFIMQHKPEKSQETTPHTPTNISTEFPFKILAERGDFMKCDNVVQKEPEAIGAREWVMAICDAVEDMLEEYDVTIPDDSRVGDEGEARLYGTSFDFLSASVTDILRNLAEKIKESPEYDLDFEKY